MINRQIMRSLPEIELPYEYITHKEAPSEFYTAIPYGKKQLAWFTYIGDKNVCLTMEINIKNLTINNLCKWPEVCSFNSELSYGTIFYGTLHNNAECKNFIIENILYYKGDKVDNVNFIEKLELFGNIFKDDICNEVYVKGQLVFYLPVMHTNKVVFDKLLDKCNYNIYCVQMRSLYGETVNVNYINKNRTMIFLAKPMIRSDIYELYSINGNENEYNSIAYIDSYKTSIMMNNIFRRIKENEDLDKIEESDSEDEFENICLDKYIVKKEAKIMCEFSSIMRKWIPIKLVEG